MQKRLLNVISLVFCLLLAGCQPSTEENPGWNKTLDLCQLAAWRSDTHVDINAACSGTKDADEILIKYLSQRNTCLEAQDFSDCLKVSIKSSSNPSLNIARKLALASGDELNGLLETIRQENRNVEYDGLSENRRRYLEEKEISPPEGWKQELDSNGLLKGKYAQYIRGSRWNAAESDWLAYHAFAAQNSPIANNRLASKITLATSLSDLDHFEESAEILSTISESDLKRVLAPDWTLYSEEKIDFDAEEIPYEQKNVLLRYSRTVGAIFAIQIQTGNQKHAKETLSNAKASLELAGPPGRQYIDLMEFLLGAEIPSDQIFDRVFLGNSDDSGYYFSRPNGLNGWETLVNKTALVSIFEKRLNQLAPDLTGSEFSKRQITQHKPNMSDNEFLRKPQQLRNFLVFYKNLLKDQIRDIENYERENFTKTFPPDHVRFTIKENKEQEIDERLLARISKAGIGTYGVSAARELPDGSLQLIYFSGAIDSSGETGVGGYWMLKGHPENGDWDDPIYLGLRSLMPYTIDGFADISDQSSSNDDRLRLVGAQQPLDLGSITFPPISMTTEEPKRGLIEIHMTKVMSDKDGDGLTDLFEERVGLNPENPDTDGDLIVDSRDSVPNLAYSAAGKDRDIAYALLSVMQYHEDGAIVQAPAPKDQTNDSLLSGLNFGKEVNSDYASYHDPIPGVLYFESEFTGFGGLDLPYMLIIQNEKEAGEMARNFPPHYPLSIHRQIVDPYSGRMIIIWSAKWVGGTVLLTPHSEGGFEIKLLSSWIT